MRCGRLDLDKDFCDFWADFWGAKYWIKSGGYSSCKKTGHSWKPYPEQRFVVEEVRNSLQISGQCNKKGVGHLFDKCLLGWEGNLGTCEFGQKHENEKTKGVLGMRKMLNTVEYRPSGIYAYLNT